MALGRRVQWTGPRMKWGGAHPAGPVGAGVQIVPRHRGGAWSSGPGATARGRTTTWSLRLRPSSLADPSLRPASPCAYTRCSSLSGPGDSGTAPGYSRGCRWRRVGGLRVSPKSWRRRVRGEKTRVKRRGSRGGRWGRGRLGHHETAPARNTGRDEGSQVLMVRFPSPNPAACFTPYAPTAPIRK